MCKDKKNVDKITPSDKNWTDKTQKKKPVDPRQKMIDQNLDDQAAYQNRISQNPHVR